MSDYNKQCADCHMLFNLYEDEEKKRKKAEAERDRLLDENKQVERIGELEDIIIDLLDGLDANSDDRCGLSEEVWERRIATARDALAGKENL